MEDVNVIPAGTKVEGYVTSVVAAQRRGRSGAITIEFDLLILPSGRSIPVKGVIVDSSKAENENRVVGSQSSAKRKGMIVVGTAAGGIVVGAIVNGSKGAGIGLAAGVGVGVSALILSKGQEAVISQGKEFSLLLTKPLVIPNASLKTKD